MTSGLVALATSVTCLVVAPELLHDSKRFDANPRAGLTAWMMMGALGWLSTVVLFVAIGLGRFHGPLLVTLVSFLRHLGDGHPLRGLGLSEVVGLSMAFDIAILILGGVVVGAFKVWELRHQQRTILDLVARKGTLHHDVSLVDHDQPLAYYLPGHGGRVVMSTGTFALLTAPEIDAVIAHERGHHHGRHGALLIPLQALAPFVSFLPFARYAPYVIRTYLEMTADDFARRRDGTHALRAALEKSPLFHQPPRGALGMYGAVVQRRIARLYARPIPVLDIATLTLGITAALSLIWTMLLAH